MKIGKRRMSEGGGGIEEEYVKNGKKQNRTFEIER